MDKVGCSEELQNVKSEIKTEDIELEELHHSIDIKEDTSINQETFSEELEYHNEAVNIEDTKEEEYESHCSEEIFPGEHTTIQAGKNLFLCNICNYKCFAKQSLQTHLQTHTGEKPYECNICDYKCSQKENFKLHLLVYTGEKPYECNICDYKCLLKGNLKKHLVVHTGEKPYECNICDYKCSVKGSLKRHLRTKHRNVMKPRLASARV